MIHFNQVSKQHGSRVLFQNVSLQILPGTRTGLVGANGAGKTTTMRAISQLLKAKSGSIRFKDR